MRDIRVWLAAVAVFSFCPAASAEDIELATAYPSPYGVYTELRAQKYCDENGANCSDGDAAKGNVVYFRNVDNFTAMGNVFNVSGTALAGDSMGAISPNPYVFTLANLKTRYPELNAETRNIIGIIVAYKGRLSSPAPTYVDSLWYMINIRSLDTATSNYIDGLNLFANDHVVYWRQFAGFDAGYLYGNIILSDFDKSGNFKLTCYFHLNTAAAWARAVTLTLGMYVVGYVVE